MQTIVIVLNPGKLANPDMDLCYCVPDRIEAVSRGAMESDGYEFIDAEKGRPGPLMGIWLKTGSAAENWPAVQTLFEEEAFLGNDLAQSAEIYISENDAEALENCTRVYPKG